jgi:hypothetical protein
VFCGATCSIARVVKLVDAGDSKSPAARRAGSIPAPGTIGTSIDVNGRLFFCLKPFIHAVFKGLTIHLGQLIYTHIKRLVLVQVLVYADTRSLQMDVPKELPDGLDDVVGGLVAHFLVGDQYVHDGGLLVGTLLTSNMSRRTWERTGDQHPAAQSAGNDFHSDICIGLAIGGASLGNFCVILFSCFLYKLPKKSHTL